MVDNFKHNNESDLPTFLISCIEEKVIDRHTAYRIENIRKTCESYIPLFMKVDPDPTLSFNTFIEYQTNALAVRLAQMVVTGQSISNGYNPVFIYGDSGLGKTHLLSAICNETDTRHVLLLNTANLEAEYLKSQKAGNIYYFRKWLQSADILLIDDVQHCSGNKELQKEIAFAIDHMVFSGRSVVMTSDRSPIKIPGIDFLLYIRLSSGVTTELVIGNETDRYSILKSYMKDDSIPESVLLYIASHINDSIRRLKSTLSQLTAIHKELSSPVTVQHAQTLIYGDPNKQIQLNNNTQSEMCNEITYENTRHSLESDIADLFKTMLIDAETEEEQALALQIALSERVRQLKQFKGTNSNILKNLEVALDLLRDGSINEAIQYINNSGNIKDISTI